MLRNEQGALLLQVLLLLLLGRWVLPLQQVVRRRLLLHLLLRPMGKLVQAVLLVLLLRLVRGGLAPLLLQMSDQALPSTQGRCRLLLLRALLLRLLLPSPLLLQSRRRCCCALALLHLLQRYAALGLRDIFKHPLQLSLRVEGGERGGDVAAAVTFPTYSPESQRCLQARCPALYCAASECKQASRAQPHPLACSCAMQAAAAASRSSSDANSRGSRLLP